MVGRREDGLPCGARSQHSRSDYCEDACGAFPAPHILPLLPPNCRPTAAW